MKVKNNVRKFRMTRFASFKKTVLFWYNKCPKWLVAIRGPILGAIIYGVLNAYGAYLFQSFVLLFEQHKTADTQIIAYKNEPNDVTIANAIFNTLKSDSSKEIQISW
jgi:hypothetical protein